MDYEWRKAGAPITQQDFGRVLAGASGGPVTVTLVNLSAFAWLTTNCALVQGDTDGARGTASVGGFVLTETAHDAGPLAVNGALDFTLGWITPAGTAGRVGDFANLAVDYTY